MLGLGLSLPVTEVVTVGLSLPVTEVTLGLGLTPGRPALLPSIRIDNTHQREDQRLHYDYQHMEAIAVSSLEFDPSRLGET